MVCCPNESSCQSPRCLSLEVGAPANWVFMAWATGWGCFFISQSIREPQGWLLGEEESDAYRRCLRIVGWGQRRWWKILSAVDLWVGLELRLLLGTQQRLCVFCCPGIFPSAAHHGDSSIHFRDFGQVGLWGRAHVH